MHSLFTTQFLVGFYFRCPQGAASFFGRQFDFTRFITFHIVRNLVESFLVVNLGLSNLDQFVLTLLLFHLTDLFNSFNYCYTGALKLSFLSSYSTATPLADR
jgi:hypothetical protein